MKDEYEGLKIIDPNVKGIARKATKALPTIVAVICVIATVCAAFLDVDIRELLTVRFAANAVLYSILFICMWSSMNENGMASGKVDSDYTDSRERYRHEREIVRTIGTRRMRDFCRSWSEEELIRARKRVLDHANVDYDDFIEDFGILVGLLDHIDVRKFSDDQKNAYRKLIHLPRAQRRAITAATKLKPIWLSESAILTDDAEGINRNPIAPSVEEIHRKDVFWSVWRIVICSLFVVSLAGDIIADPDVGTVIFGIIKVLSVIFVGMRGYVKGLLLYAEKGVAYNESRTNLMIEYEGWIADRDGLTRDKAVTVQDAEVIESAEEVKTDATGA